ncbi:MAG: WhiB family transcriptional regulator [Actinomycetota bacterium]
MIKRTKRSERQSRPTGGLSDERIAELNGRPTELAAAPHDPDSPTAWMAEGNCRLHPPATFFPSDGVGVDKARKICRDCPVKMQCLDYALDERIDHGVWGGCSERERRRILKRRRVDVGADAAVAVDAVG